MTIDHDLPTSGVDDRAVHLMRRAGDLSLPPPPSVWEGLVGALRSGGGHPPAGVSDLGARRAGRRDGGRGRTGGFTRRRPGGATGRPAGATGRPGGTAGRPGGTTGPSGGTTGRWGSPYALLAAAAAGALVVVAGDWVLDQGGTSQQDQVLAFTGLGPVPDAADQVDVSARAEVVDHDGRRVLRVDLDQELPTSEGYLEVWLLRADVSGMVTLGVLEGNHAELLLPEGVSLEEYPVVDVSVEAVDGDPAHGGRSLLRGELTTGQEVSALQITPAAPSNTAPTPSP